MQRRASGDGKPTSAVISDQRGFTLIELLMSMLVLAVFMSGAVTLLTTSFHTENGTVARAAATNQAEVRLEVLTRDVRNAVTCPSGVTLGMGATATYGIEVTAGPQIQMCDPSPGLPAAGTGDQLPLTSVVTWTCASGSPATDTCDRCVTPTSAAPPTQCGTGSPGLTNSIVGVLSLALSGLTGTPASLVPSLSGPYALTTGGISWIGINAQLAQLSYPNSGSGSGTVMPGSKPIALETGIDLRNYGE